MWKIPVLTGIMLPFLCVAVQCLYIHFHPPLQLHTPNYNIIIVNLTILFITEYWTKRSHDPRSQAWNTLPYNLQMAIMYGFHSKENMQIKRKLILCGSYLPSSISSVCTSITNCWPYLSCDNQTKHPFLTRKKNHVVFKI